MTGSTYPGMTQPFGMAHGANMAAVSGMRQDAMGKFPSENLLSSRR